MFDLARQSEDGTLAENQKRLQEIEDRNQQAAREAEVKKREVRLIVRVVASCAGRAFRAADLFLRHPLPWCRGSCRLCDITHCQSVV